MDIVKFAKEWDRMCKTFRLCSGCPIRKLINEKEKNYTCRDIFCIYPEEVVPIIEKWSAEHPAKTRQSEFLKMYPYASLFRGYIDICPKKIDVTIEDSVNCNITACDECKSRYWSKEVE